jgi:hypothetical protein
MAKRTKKVTTKKVRAKSAVSAGAACHVLAGRPSKQAVTAVFGTSGYALSWLARVERLGITPERLLREVQGSPEGVKADWAALTAKKA